ncbi:p450-domain-containing protein [Artomyces pyxidatus]|uniref:P450-domain-containing protein n=1 Tax=Artomyces pyxidatus TaxID=48021 RepID=A0ACB8SIE9_9AGAM|nr:p450-domain-containing protein [Artomyces pyxidatus]
MASAAGADTTSISLHWWLLAIILHPETQKRAQAELDTVVGRDRVPAFSDSPRLPYIRAMVKETLRSRWPCRTPRLRTIGTRVCSSRRARSASRTSSRAVMNPPSMVTVRHTLTPRTICTPTARSRRATRTRRTRGM